MAWGCRWIYEDNGVWREMCYCEDQDGCNSSPRAATISAYAIIGAIPFALLLPRFLRGHWPWWLPVVWSDQMRSGTVLNDNQKRCHFFLPAAFTDCYMKRNRKMKNFWYEDDVHIVFFWRVNEIRICRVALYLVRF